MLVTIRLVNGLPSLREELLFAGVAVEIKDALARGARIVEYSIQENHLHLLVEAEDKERLSRAMQRLFSRIAMMVNRLLRRSGRVFRDRHHRRELTTPSQTRNALVYVLFNRRKHLVQQGVMKQAACRLLDPCSSIAWFEGWAEARPAEDILLKMRDGPCVRGAPPRTWLARVGWVRGGGRVKHSELPRVD